MVKIENISSYAMTARLKKKESAKDKTGFSISASASDTPETPFISAPQSAGEVASLTTLMHIQEVGERDANSKQAFVAGESILKSLEKLQNEILVGAISKQSLEHIVSMTKTLPTNIMNPQLNQIIAEIKQRAMVELAKIEMSTQSSL
jgi:hypothetical protein